MAGQKFQYDESGSTFLYFLTSFLVLVLLPSTYYFWPADKVEEVLEKKTEVFRRKISRLQKPQNWKGLKKGTQRILIAAGWLFMACLVYKIQQFDYEYANFDPYDILGVSLSSSQADIKKAYRRQSLILHPDKPTGNERKFMKLNKAYQALTDDVSRRNYELYGHPDGPGAMNFGIALPSWIIEKENSLWVLGLYGLVFMIALPTVVAVWWYRSSKFSNDQVLLDTTQLYYYFFHKTPHMMFKRALMVLAASLEFEKRHNPEIVERPTDNTELPPLMKQLTNLGEKNVERPLCFPYSVKARTLLHAHLSRLRLPFDTLDQDRMYIVKCCPTLIQEMVTCVAQLIMLAHAGRINRLPSLDTIEAVMKLSSSIVQALWEAKSPLMQLPHISDETLRHFVSKRKAIRSIEQFASLPANERRYILRSLNDDEYEDVIIVCKQMPIINMEVKCEVVDDDDSGEFTAGAIVTVTVVLVRQEMGNTVWQGDEGESLETMEGGGGHLALSAEETEKKSGWRKPAQKKGGKSKVKPVSKKKPHLAIKKEEETHEEKKDGDEKEKKLEIVKKKEGTSDEKKKRTERVEELSGGAGGGGGEDSDEDSSISHSDESQADDADSESHHEDKLENHADDDDEWERFQKGLNKREKVLEGKSRVSHSVHCPHFPEDKQEYWWAYVCDRKKRLLITAPYQVTSLVDHEEIQLKFTAPPKPGIYTYQVCLRSDSYLAMDQSHDIKLDVKEAKEIPTEHPQWQECSSDEEGDDDDEDEEKKGDGEDDSEFTTDEELTDDSEEE